MKETPRFTGKATPEKKNLASVSYLPQSRNAYSSLYSFETQPPTELSKLMNIKIGNNQLNGSDLLKQNSNSSLDSLSEQKFLTS